MDKSIGFQDIIKKSILKADIFDKISILNMVMCLLVSFLVGLFIFYIYKKTNRSPVYNHSYNISLVIMCILTASIILVISSNVVLSLGMVGALSIVRYRTALKDPMDVMYMFWSISAGISAGAGLYPVCVITALFIGGIMILFSKKRFNEDSYLLVIHYDESAHENVKKVIDRMKYSTKSKTVSNGKVELTLELRISGDNTLFVNNLSSIEGVKDAVLINYRGDFAA